MAAILLFKSWARLPLGPRLSRPMAEHPGGDMGDAVLGGRAHHARARRNRSSLRDAADRLRSFAVSFPRGVRDVSVDQRGSQPPRSSRGRRSRRRTAHLVAHGLILLSDEMDSLQPELPRSSRTPKRFTVFLDHLQSLLRRARLSRRRRARACRALAGSGGSIPSRRSRRGCRAPPRRGRCSTRGSRAAARWRCRPRGSARRTSSSGSLRDVDDRRSPRSRIVCSIQTT